MSSKKLNSLVGISCNRCEDDVIINNVAELNDLLNIGWHVNTESDCHFCPTCNGGQIRAYKSVILEKECYD